MRKLAKCLPLALLLSAALFTPMAHAQGAAKQEAPKPPDSPSKVLLNRWNDNGRKLIAMAEDFPEDKYDFKPNPAQRSFAEQLLHAKDLPEVMRLHGEYVQAQRRALAEQASEMGQTVGRTAMEATRSKH